MCVCVYIYIYIYIYIYNRYAGGSEARHTRSHILLTDNDINTIDADTKDLYMMYTIKRNSNTLMIYVYVCVYIYIYIYIVVYDIVNDICL